MRSKFLKSTMGVAAALTWLSPSNAATITASGTITSIWLSSTANAAFRAYVKQGAVDQLTACTYNFAAINVSEDNYAAKTAALLTAYSGKKDVTHVLDGGNRRNV